MTTKSARSLFLDAVELPPERWSEYLDDVCEGDLELHQKILRLLAAHQQVTGFMNQPAVEGSVTVEHSREKIGALIGPKTASAFPFQ